MLKILSIVKSNLNVGLILYLAKVEKETFDFFNVVRNIKSRWESEIKKSTSQLTINDKAKIEALQRYLHK